MEQTPSPSCREPVPPELQAIDRYLKDALRLPRLGEAEARAWAAEAQARLTQQSPVARAPRTRRNTGWPHAAGLRAGVIGVALLIGVAVWSIADRSTGRTVTGTTWRIVTTPAGQQSRFHLPDGSSVTLTPGSTLRYDASFARTDRTIELDGEALFTVTHRNGSPFTVATTNAAVRVLGTTFAVRHHRTDTATRVIVAEGRVAVGDAVLGIGDAAMILAGPRIVVEHGVDISSALAWTSGRLVFDRTPLRDVLPELSRWYGMTVTVSDTALLARRVTTALDIQSPRESLEILTALLRARVTYAGDTITFSRQ